LAIATAAAASVLPFKMDQILEKLEGKRDFKLTVVNHYCENNLYQTSKRFSLNTKTILRWVADKEKQNKAKKGSKHTITVRKAAFPEMETELCQEYKALRKRGLKVKGFWFKTKGRQQMQKHHFNFLMGGLMASSSDKELDYGMHNML
jgi:transposase-like protein